MIGRLGGRSSAPEPEHELPAPPTSTDILASVERVQQQIEGRVRPAVTARVLRITGSVEEMVPRLDRLGGGSQQAHTVVATATSYLPEAVGAYLRLPRDFADRRVVAQGKTSLMLLCDQLDLLGVTLDKISASVSRAAAAALVAHRAFLAVKGRGSASARDPGAGRGTPQPGPPSEPGRLEAP